MKTHLLLAASLFLAVAADAEPLISITRTRTVKRAGPASNCAMERWNHFLILRATHQMAGNALAALQCKPEEAARVLELMDKFLAWEKVARDNQTESFRKEIGLLQQDSTPLQFNFRWEKGGAILELSRLGANSRFEVSVVAAFVDMLRNDLPGVEKEFAERTAKSEKEEELFK